MVKNNTTPTEINDIIVEIRSKAAQALVRAQAALLDAQLEVQKWEKFLREYQHSSD